MIKLLHFADLHLGVENYGRIDPATGLSTRLVDFLRAYDQVVDYALENDISLVIFAGDAYKTRDPNPTYQREFARRIRRISARTLSSCSPAAARSCPILTFRFSTFRREFSGLCRGASRARILRRSLSGFESVCRGLSFAPLLW